jgi:hypothetical protein
VGRLEKLFNGSSVCNRVRTLHGRAFSELKCNGHLGGSPFAT